MRALGFKDRWAPSVMSGDKPFTLRRAWKRPGDMPDVEDRVQIVTGWRTPQRKVIGTARVAFRCEVEFSAEGIIRFDHWRRADMVSPMAERVRVNMVRAVDAHPTAWTLGSAERACEAFARLDGFESWDAFWAFHDQHRARRADTRSMVRELIGFDRIAEEFAS